MITEYHRPKSLDEALTLLGRVSPKTLPLGGGTVLNQPGGETLAVVDLQGLNLDGIELAGNRLLIGASATLQSILDSTDVPLALKTALKQETNLHIRQVGTAAGTLAAADGRSTFTSVCLAADTRLVWAPGDVESSLGDWLAVRSNKPGLLITSIIIPSNIKLTFHTVGRTPGDWPLVCAAAARWPSGRIRLVLGGFGPAPVTVMDGLGSEGIPSAARDAFSQAGDDWATAEYRSETAEILTRRCLKDIEAI